jgi:hypothetical protein
VTAFRAAEVKGGIGPCLQLAPCYPADPSEEAVAAARTADVVENALYLDPLLRARYPGLSKLDSQLAAGIRAAVREGDLTAVSAPVDFLVAAAASPVTTRGLSWTTSNGPPGTHSAGGLSGSTSTPCSAALRHPPCGTRPSREVTSSNPNDHADGTLYARLIDLVTCPEPVLRSALIVDRRSAVSDRVTR